MSCVECDSQLPDFPCGVNSLLLLHCASIRIAEWVSQRCPRQQQQRSPRAESDKWVAHLRRGAGRLPEVVPEQQLAVKQLSQEDRGKGTKDIQRTDHLCMSMRSPSHLKRGQETGETEILAWIQF